MTTSRLLALFVPAIAIAAAGAAHAQLHRVGPTNPDSLNQQRETMEQIRVMQDKQWRADELARRCAALPQNRPETGTQAPADCGEALQKAQVARFMAAIEPRRHRFADFDRVVFHGKTPLSQDMIALMAESPYAADIAYYLGQHPDQADAIARMHLSQAGLAVRQLAATIAAQDKARP